jgi:hypothetical protein
MPYVRYVHVTRLSIFISDKLSLSSDRMLRKTMVAKVQLQKNLVVNLEGLGAKTN